MAFKLFTQTWKKTKMLFESREIDQHMPFIQKKSQTSFAWHFFKIKNFVKECFLKSLPSDKRIDWIIGFQFEGLSLASHFSCH
jgi:hypothetical protein